MLEELAKMVPICGEADCQGYVLPAVNDCPTQELPEERSFLIDDTQVKEKRDRLEKNSDGQERIGHQFDIEFAVKLDEKIGGKRLYFQVWDEGKQILSCGGNEWWHGEPNVVSANKRKYDKRNNNTEQIDQPDKK